MEFLISLIRFIASPAVAAIDVLGPLLGLGLRPALCLRPRHRRRLRRFGGGHRPARHPCFRP